MNFRQLIGMLGSMPMPSPSSGIDRGSPKPRREGRRAASVFLPPSKSTRQRTRAELRRTNWESYRMAGADKHGDLPLRKERRKMARARAAGDWADFNLRRAA